MYAAKQIDRILSNKGVSVWDLSEPWVKYVLADHKEIMVALDWTSFFDDEQSMLSLNIVTRKGLATPLLWKSVDKKQLKHNRARYEDQLFSRLKTVLPANIKVTLLANRGFADQKFFRFLDEELGFKYIIRIKSNTTILHKDVTNKAGNWLKPDGRSLGLKKAFITLVELGQAGEEIGFDKKLKVNTVKTRTHSLFRQGQFYYRFFFRFTQEEQEN